MILKNAVSTYPGGRKSGRFSQFFSVQQFCRYGNLAIHGRLDIQGVVR